MQFSQIEKLAPDYHCSAARRQLVRELVAKASAWDKQINGIRCAQQMQVTIDEGKRGLTVDNALLVVQIGCQDAR